MISEPENKPITIFQTEGYLPCTSRLNYRSIASRSMITNGSTVKCTPSSEARCLHAFYETKDQNNHDAIIGWDGDILLFESDKLPDSYRKVSVTYRSHDDRNYEFFKITADGGDIFYGSFNKKDLSSPVLFDSDTTPIIPETYGSLIELGEATLKWINNNEERVKANEVSIVENLSDVVIMGGIDITQEVYGDEEGDLSVSAAFFQGGWFIWESDNIRAPVVTRYACVRTDAISPKEIALNYSRASTIEVDPVDISSPLQLFETIQNCISASGRTLTRSELARLYDLILIQQKLWGLKRITHFLQIADKHMPGFIVSKLTHSSSNTEFGNYPRETFSELGWQCDDWKTLVYTLRDYHDKLPSATKPIKCLATLINYDENGWKEFYTVLALIGEIDLMLIKESGGNYFLP